MLVSKLFCFFAKKKIQQNCELLGRLFAILCTLPHFDDFIFIACSYINDHGAVLLGIWQNSAAISPWRLLKLQNCQCMNIIYEKIKCDYYLYQNNNNGQTSNV